MFKQIFELFKSDSLQEQALTECYEMLEIVREMYNESVKTLRHSDTTEIPIDIYKTGVCLPSVSCFFLAYILTKIIDIIAAITE